VYGICRTWAGSFDNSFALSLGFTADDEKVGFDGAVADFKAELTESKA